MVPGIMRRAIYTSQYSQRVRVLSKPELKKILYIEDDLDIQEVARMALEVVGDHEIALCSSGREALEEVS
jgi:PleD family two-component response regulator|tara:strand:- start:760 stop:969 length:210 start_codon:yes stop_codon:yes gene_type:complete